MTEQHQAPKESTQSNPPPPTLSGSLDPVFMSYHHGHKHAVLVRTDATTTKERITHIHRFGVVFENGEEMRKLEFVGSFFGPCDQLVVGECERREIAKRPSDRPCHHQLQKIFHVSKGMIGAKMRISLACGWVVEGLLSNVRRFSVGIQMPGNHWHRANILRHAIVDFEVVAEPGADEHSTSVIEYWEQARKKYREKDAQKLTQSQPASEAEDKDGVSTSQSDVNDEAVA